MLFLEINRGKETEIKRESEGEKVEKGKKGKRKIEEGGGRKGKRDRQRAAALYVEKQRTFLALKNQIRITHAIS